METPNFVKHPPNKSEMETIRLIAADKKLKEVADLRFLSMETIKAHTRSLRYKFHCSSITRVVFIMLYLGFLKFSEVAMDIPAGWQVYRQR
jgi:DNA-binding CsgD family transcriptional regulator